MKTVQLSETGSENSDVMSICCPPSTDVVRNKKQPNNDYVKRPLNKFMLFAKMQRPKIREKNPLMNQKDISSMLGKEWKLLSPDEQQEYEKKAINLKHLHKKKFPSYRFCPKRRGTSTKKPTHFSEGFQQIQPVMHQSTQKPHRMASTNPELTYLPYIVFNNIVYVSTNIQRSSIESMPDGTDEPPMFNVQNVRPGVSTDS